MGTLHEVQYTFLIISHSVLLRMRNVSDKTCRENQNTHFIFSNSPPLPHNCAVYEIMGKNFVEPERPLMTVRCMHSPCWITKATNTYSEQACVMLIAFPRQQWLHKHASMLRISFIVCLVSTYVLLFLSVFYLFVCVICNF